ncbi:hypothetical protein GGQ74_002003 [Desulfobaculum xiamenense]|uniref:Uncharacterized protein n=1 Tax=Desulfobaculum xiamenense TaxID=995050 RepID=A0A846QMT9_9BACT|nr:hypothetical protein [Desulfobaculum xiamenense]NJB68330.1 hypothetical protein [Desulfobaculum xiamenense]
MWKLITHLSLIMFLLMGAPINAHALLGSGIPDLGAFKGQNSVRQTLVYIDTTMMIDGDVTWAKRIDSKLAGSLMPGEKLVILGLDPSKCMVEEVWTGYWPDYPPDEITRLKEGRGLMNTLFSEDPLEQLPEQQQFFRNQVGAALGKIYEQGKTEALRDKHKSVMSSLAADEDRMYEPGMATRVILYSGMGDPEASSALSLDLGNAVFYVFGVKDQVRNKATWEELFLHDNGLLVAFGSDLEIASGAPVFVKRYDLEFATTKNEFMGEMVLMATPDGKLQDSYATLRSVEEPRMSVLKGICKINGSTIKIHAKTASGLATKEADELFELAGPIHGNLTGRIGHPGYKIQNTNQFAVFKLTAVAK